MLAPSLTVIPMLLWTASLNNFLSWMIELRSPEKSETFPAVMSPPIFILLEKILRPEAPLALTPPPCICTAESERSNSLILSRVFPATYKRSPCSIMEGTIVACNAIFIGYDELGFLSKNLCLSF